jgi:NAD(P) transhydrogenase subunit alpha
MEALQQFEFLFFIFILAMFLGLELITKVPSQLHTPLMSGSNAISGISLVGALITLDSNNADSTLTTILGACAVGFATINVVGGYLVTDRMLEMFKTRPAAGKKEGGA